MALLSPWLRTFVDFKAYWGGALVQVPVISDYLPGILFDPVDEYKVIWEIGAILKGYFISGTFPVFPWLAYPLIGFVVGRRIVGKQIRQELPLYQLIGLVLILLGATVSYASLFRIGSSPISDYIAPLSFYPNSITLFYLQLGVALVLFALLFFYFDGRDGLTPIGGWLVNWYKRMSRFSLTVYFLHYLVISWPLWIIYFLTGHYPAQDLMGAIPALLLGLAAVALFLLGLKAWEQYEAKFSLEWMLRRFTEDVTGSKEGKT
jgi:surface polysaccharide O-acyltransferase-like enzyme